MSSNFCDSIGLFLTSCQSTSPVAQPFGKYFRCQMVPLLLLFAPLSLAQCVNTPTPTCDVYQNCFAKLCPCTGSKYEYFVSYGKKYCQVFLDLPGLSTKGKAWRDSTLKCLQETVVPTLPKDGQESTCNCEEMQKFAFDSHIACYTKAGNSICSLSKDDWYSIFMATNPVMNLVDSKGRKQIVEVAKICLPELATDAREWAQKIVDGVKP